MAEDECLYDLDMFELQLQCLLSRYSSEELQKDNKLFCSDYFELTIASLLVQKIDGLNPILVINVDPKSKLVKEYTSRWHVPLPQLMIIEKALLYFTQATSSWTSSCDHLLNTLSSLALSIYELLLFFDANHFDQEPLKHFTVTFQECYANLTRHQNVHLQQVVHLVQNGGPWASASMQAILNESSLSHYEVDECLSSELPVFFELRVRYLLSCKRITDALALAKCCAQHPATGQHLFFLQTFLTWLHKSSQHDRLQKEVADFTGKDAVHTICSMEFEETDETLLALSRAFLSHQLKNRDMQCLCDLVFIWSKLHSRLNTPKEAFIEESLQLMSSSTDVHSIFPFIRALTQELGEQAIQFCVEICTKALQSCLPHDVFTKSLIYKTIAGLLQNDLEVCRACALLVFFLERSVEAYKLVYVLYMHPDQEYHVDHNLIQNHIRFEMLQVLKKDLCFDPEFWNLSALRTNCLELMSEKVVGDALKEIMEEKWVASYCCKFVPIGSRILSRQNEINDAAVKKRQQREAVQNTPKRLHAGQSQSRLNIDHTVRRRRRGHNSGCVEQSSSEPLRRSFWQLDRRHGIGQRRTTRFSEKSSTKRRIRQPKWLLEDSGSLEENIVPSKFRRMRRQGMGWKRADSGQTKNNTNRKLQVDSDIKAAEHDKKKQNEFSLDCVKPSVEPQILLELSLPDNELPGTFIEETCHSPRGFPQKLLLKQTLSVPAEIQPVKAAHGKEVILRARDLTMLVQLLHCYGRRQKGSGGGTNVPGSVSTITRSSVQGGPPKGPPRENKSAAAKLSKSTVSPRSLNGLDAEIDSEKKILGKTSLPSRVYSARRKKCVPGEEPAVEINVSIASQTGAIDKLPQHTADNETSQSPILNHVAQIEGQDHKRPQSPCKEALLNAGDLQFCPSKTVHTVKEQVENLSERSELTYAPAQPSKLSLQQSDHKIQPSHQVGRNESISRKLNAQSSFGATTSLSASGNPQCPVMNEEEASDNDMEPDESTILSEESKLEFSCTSCQKVFKGSRVVEHAMFHFRKDECMFCWTTFKDDLLAMMHMSDHIEKLKKAANKTNDSCVAETKSITPLKTKTRIPANAATGSRSGMLRSSSTHHKSSRLAGQDKLLKSEEPLRKRSIHRLNGHVSNKNSLGRRKGAMSKSKIKWLLRQRVRTQVSAENRADNQSSVKNSSSLKENKNMPVRMLRIHNFRKDTKQKRTMVEKSLTSLEKVHCPADGCTWNADLTKKRVALLYHALESHRGDKKPLQLSFEIANSKCSICMRVLWSFEHFQHHVERHRLTPRHPCLHQGCTARFKTGMQMRRHARMHNPLQARCCRPGCSKLFICLWALNLHEKDHYAVKSTKESRCNSIPINDISHACTKNNTNYEPEGRRASLGGSSAALLSDIEASVSSVVLKMENDLEHTNKLRDLPDTGHAALPKETAQDKNLAASKTLKALSSFLLKHRYKMRPNLMKNSVQVNRRKQGRPCKRREEESLPRDSETVENRPGQTKLEDVEVTQVGVHRRRGRPSKVKENTPDGNSGAGPTTDDVKEKNNEISITRARLEDKRDSQVNTAVQRRRGRPPKLRPVTKCVKGEAGPMPIISSKLDDKEETMLLIEPVKRQKRGRPLKTKKEMPNNKWKGGSKTGSVRDGTHQKPTMTTRFKKKWQQVRLNTKFHRTGQRAINLNGTKKRNVNLETRVTDENIEKVVNQQKSSHAVQKGMSHTSSSKASEESTVGTNSHDKIRSQDADSKKPQQKHSNEVFQDMSSAHSQSKKTKVEENTTGKGKKRKVCDKTSQPKSVTHQAKELPVDGVSEETVNAQEAVGDVLTPSSLEGRVELEMPAKKAKSTVCVDTLIEYAKKPYLRLPPTAYLDEKYTAMPKRKKEVLVPQLSQTNPLQEPANAVASQQRHRCANCFAIFNSSEELQEHRRLQSCSNLFGFDSDEEGNC